MKKILLAIVVVFFCQSLNSEAGIWIRPAAVKQGEIVVASGLFYEFDKNNSSFLGECTINLDNQKYKFSKEILDNDAYQKSNGQHGYHFISRIPTTPLSSVGKKQLVLQCPNGAQAFSLDVNPGGFTIQNIQLSKKKNSLQRTKIEDEAVRKAINFFSETRNWDKSKPWLIPNTARRSSNYGLRRKYNGVLAQNYFHKGVDYAGWTGSPITAPARGKVILLGRESEGFAVHGNCLFIDHGQGVVSAYLHLSEFSVSEGQEVEAGQLLGKVGNTGIATGPHLHFGVYVNGENVNPDLWLQFAIP